LNGHRGELHEIIFNYARDELGIPIHLGQRVSEYFEDNTQAGIILKTEEKVFYIFLNADLSLTFVPDYWRCGDRC
jgi:hypothetical protein